MSENDNLYAAYKAKDARFDGRFFVGISTTGIYCRPVCRARQAKAKNCTFYSTAAQAEQNGFRPCLLCRPELAPGNSITDATATLAQRAARIIEENCGGGLSLDELAGRIGCTGRHLSRVFTAQFNVTPVQYFGTCRLLLAKNLLTDTGLSILDVAMAAGFGSLRRFNDLFKNRYQLSPSDLRKRIPAGCKADGNITLALGYRPPYRFEEILRLLDERAIPGVELIANGEYWRTVDLVDPAGRRVCGSLRVGHRPQKNVLTVTLSETLLSALPQILAKVRHLFDLYCDPSAIYETLSAMSEIRPGLCLLGTRLPGCFDAFEIAVCAILGQESAAKTTKTLAARLVCTLGATVQTDIAGLTRAFPAPKDILALEEPIENHLEPLGITAAQARTVYKLAQVLESREIDLEHCDRPEAETEKLAAVAGIGSRTAEYIAMRTTGWTDAFSEGDAAIKKALAPRTPKEICELSEAWRPWRSYAAINIWNSLKKED